MESGRNAGQTKMRRLLPALLCVILLAAADQFTKYLAASGLREHGPAVLIKGVFQLCYVENTGAAFGILQGRTWLIVLFVAAILCALGAFYVKIPADRKYRPLKTVLAVLGAGAVGNLIDRLRFGYVIDFFYFELIDFPVFNVADCYVTVSAALLVVLVLFYYKEDDFSFLGRRKDP